MILKILNIDLKIFDFFKKVQNLKKNDLLNHIFVILGVNCEAVHVHTSPVVLFQLIIFACLGNSRAQTYRSIP